jgi:hypothetical protein
MGYTVYWTFNKRPTTAQRKKIVAYIKTLLKKYPKVIAPDSNRVSATEINFNGIGKNSHETFAFFENDEDFNFTKTAEKPYDHQVKLALMYMKQVLGDGIEISCDGGAATDPAGWEKVLKRGNIIPQ